MVPALTLEAIETHVLRKQRTYGGVLLVFSAYNGEGSGTNYDFLRKVTDYHYHSGDYTDCYCVGYSLYESTPSRKHGRAIPIPDEVGWPLTQFYPELFHNVRRKIAGTLDTRWDYNGGIDLLLFPVRGGEAAVDWTQAAVVSSRKHVGSAFQDIDHMVRTVINMNERMIGELHPNTLGPAITRAAWSNRFVGVAKAVGGDAIAGAITLL